METHNYPAVNSVTQKKRNWNTLVTKVFKKRLGMTLTSQRIDDLANARQFAIEKTLLEAREALMRKRESIQAAPAARQRARNRKGMDAGRGAAAGNGGPGGPGVGGPGMGMMAGGGMMGMGGQQAQQQMRMMQQQQAAAAAAQQQQQQQFMQMQQQMSAQQQLQMAMPGHSQSMGMIPHSMAPVGDVDRSILMQKEEKIQELRKVKEILELKIKKLEQLVNLKDSKIVALQQKLSDVGVGR